MTKKKNLNIVEFVEIILNLELTKKELDILKAMAQKKRVILPKRNGKTSLLNIYKKYLDYQDEA